MSGTTSTNPFIPIQDIVGDNILGDEQIDQANEGLTDLSDALEDADEPVDDLAADVENEFDDDDGTGATGTGGAGTAGTDGAGPAQGATDGAAEPGTGTGGTDAPADPTAPGAPGTTDGGEQTGASAAFAWITPHNNSGAQALARLTLDGTTLSIDVRGLGFTPGEAHTIVLAGFPDGTPSRAPTVALDADGNGRLDGGEIVANTGQAVVAFDSPVADGSGRISSSTSVTLNPADPNSAALLQVLQNGLDGDYLAITGLGGTSGYDPVLPAAGGVLASIDSQLAAALNPAAGPAPGVSGSVFDAALAAQAPYMLAPGGGPLAPEPTANPTAEGASSFVSFLAPANNSGAMGAASITFDETGGTVTIDLDLAGLEPGRVHAMHIHGFMDDRASLVPNLQLDADRDGFVESSEAMPVVGPVLFGLTTDGSITDAMLTGSFPVADEAGRISLEQTYSFNLADPVQATIFGELQDRMAGRQIEVHGLTTTAAQGAGTRGEVAGEAGYQPTLSVASGAVLPFDVPGGNLAAGLGALVQANVAGEVPTLEDMLAAIQPAATGGTDGLIG